MRHMSFKDFDEVLNFEMQVGIASTFRKRLKTSLKYFIFSKIVDFTKTSTAQEEAYLRGFFKYLFPEEGL